MACRRLDSFAFLLLALALLTLPLRWLIAVMLAIAVHELGHYAALRAFGISVFEFKIGVDGAKMVVGHMQRWQEFLCALAGPVAGLSLILFARWLPRTAVCAMIHSIYNLLPVFPLDGGRVFSCICCNKTLCRCIEVICLVLIAIAGVYGSIVLSLGLLPMAASILTIHRALAGKGLAKTRLFRYNSERIYE